ncbi:uncharacterized protein LOC124842201 isoform X1 [Vigna umbellata]|uniref:uncharacterized protein LOC124842201 isoform X1 n=1 Tax=Vigna umbellata TaxID=87088 RepID=UPI001F5F7E28|nr:uncharacterized protein LOC124842201 isoform X1 [Vigna umbellata]
MEVSAGKHESGLAIDLEGLDELEGEGGGLANGEGNSGDRRHDEAEGVIRIGGLQRGVCRGENACRGRGEKFEEPWATRRCWRERREGKSFEYLVFFWTVCGARLSNSSFPLRTATFVMAPTVAFVMAPTVAFFSLRGRKGVCVSGE